jgi:hypothetical protein
MVTSRLGKLTATAPFEAAEDDEPELEPEHAASDRVATMAVAAATIVLNPWVLMIASPCF